MVRILRRSIEIRGRNRRRYQYRRQAVITETMTVTAPDISCEHCQRAIEGALGALPGVDDVHVEIPTKAVRVSYDPARVSRQQIEAAMDDEGYPVAS